jgi:plastocyanin
MSRRRAGWVVSAAVIASVLSGIAGPALGDAKVSPSAHAASLTVNVTAVEYKFTLSARSARHGRVIFRIRNRGHLPHNFKINGVTSRLIAPGGSASITVNFKTKGNYRYMCTVPGHAALGMKGTFRVT